jgi:hypothetical protein
MKKAAQRDWMAYSPAELTLARSFADRLTIGKTAGTA